MVTSFVDSADRPSRKSETRNPKQIQKHQKLENEGNGDKLLLRFRRSLRTMRTIAVKGLRFLTAD
jgi:hypothetical protein